MFVTVKLSVLAVAAAPLASALAYGVAVNVWLPTAGVHAR